jgi:hypothetical protein
MVFERFGAYVVVCHDGQAPPFETWETYMSHALAGILADEIRGFLIVTEGGGPNAMQRRQLEMTMRSQGLETAPPSAIVTDAWSARQLAIIVSWFIPTIRTFAKRDTEKALDFLNVPAAQRQEILTAVTRLQAQLPVPAASRPT